MAGIFNSAIFNNRVFNTGGTPGTGVRPSGGTPYSGHEVRQRSKKELDSDRAKFGIITPEAETVLRTVAARQSERLEQDEQKRFEELSRELELQGIQWESRYLEALNAYRDFLISEEIAARLQDKLAEEEMFMVVMLAAV